MSLTSEQARVIAAAPRMPAEVADQAISMYAEGASDAEVHERFPSWAEGTFRNRRRGWKEQIDDLRRARTVQFSDIEGARKAARVDRDWALSSIFMMLIRKHLESCYAVNPETGEREFVEQLVDSRKLKDYAGTVMAANKRVMIETGQQPQPAPGLNELMMRRNLVGSSDLHLVDQGGDWTPRTVTYGRKLSQAEKDARAEPALEYWSALNVELQERLAVLREGRDPGPRSEMLQATSALSVEERAAWAANSFEFWEGRVGEAEDKFAEPEPEPDPGPAPASAPEPAPEPVPDVPLEPPPGFSSAEGEWVLVDD